MVVEAVKPKCVGAFLRPCKNRTDRQLCDDCYAAVQAALDDPQFARRYWPTKRAMKMTRQSG